MIGHHVSPSPHRYGDPPWAATLRTDTATVTVPTGIPLPAYLGTMTDPNFGTKITRITGDPGAAMANVAGGTWGQMPRAHYSLDQAWNCDESVIYLDTNREADGVVPDTANPSGRIYLDGSTYAPLPYSGVSNPGDVRWHPRLPHAMFYVTAGGEFGLFMPSTGAQTVVRTFTGYTSMLIGHYKGFYSADGDVIVFQAVNAASAICFFAYRISTDTKFPDIVMAANESQISRNGKFISATDGNDNITIYDLFGNVVQYWPGSGGAGQPSHHDLTVDQAGDEVAVGTGKVGTGGKVIKRRLRDGLVTVLTSNTVNNYAQHTSTRATKHPGWAFVSYADDQAAYPLYQGELVAVKLDGSKVCRICHLHANNVTKPDYYGQAQTTVSPSGTRLIFGTTWYDPNGNSRPVYSMLVDLR